MLQCFRYNTSVRENCITDLSILDRMKTNTYLQLWKKLRLRRSSRKDSMKIEELVYDYYYQLVPVVDGFSKKDNYL